MKQYRTHPTAHQLCCGSGLGENFYATLGGCQMDWLKADVYVDL
mgnify:CR=1 FL=1